MLLNRRMTKKFVVHEYPHNAGIRLICGFNVRIGFCND